MKTQTAAEPRPSAPLRDKRRVAHKRIRPAMLLRNLITRWWFWVLVVVATALVIVHTFLAIWVRDYVNRKLSEIPGYRAHVAAVTLHLWRGAYQIHRLDIKNQRQGISSVLRRAAH